MEGRKERQRKEGLIGEWDEEEEKEKDEKEKGKVDHW